ASPSARNAAGGAPADWPALMPRLPRRATRITARPARSSRRRTPPRGRNAGGSSPAALLAGGSPVRSSFPSPILGTERPAILCRIPLFFRQRLVQVQQDIGHHGPGSPLGNTRAAIERGGHGAGGLVIRLITHPLLPVE